MYPILTFVLVALRKVFKSRQTVLCLYRREWKEATTTSSTLLWSLRWSDRNTPMEYLKSLPWSASSTPGEVRNVRKNLHRSDQRHSKRGVDPLNWSDFWALLWRSSTSHGAKRLPEAGRARIHIGDGALCNPRTSFVMIDPAWRDMMHAGTRQYQGIGHEISEARTSYPASAKNVQIWMLIYGLALQFQIQ
ncbi:hypothetical protein C8R44DRAFT_732837 [Mycena epipterygia]|nr:hypothetical protein C8R44DRAFT_732837 [Mycena epipterygia]